MIIIVQAIAVDRIFMILWNFVEFVFSTEPDNLYIIAIHKGDFHDSLKPFF
ncbi:hypothetical protein [Microcoleus sp. B4-C1]|uniref:hypothetical protein n=1 Tax=Microcoleus sp. B4-C1 TaxID=2818660 RepID=UPI002FCFC461